MADEMYNLLYIIEVLFSITFKTLLLILIYKFINKS